MPRPAAVARAAAGGILLGLAVGWNFTSVAAVAPALASDYGTSLAVVGLLTTAFWFTHMALQLPSGRAADLFGPRPVGLASLALILAGNGLGLAAADPALGVAARALVGVGTGLGFVSGSDYLRLAAGGPFAQGVFGGSAMGGGGLALALVPSLYAGTGWRSPYASAAAVAAVALLALALAPSRRTPGLHSDAGRLSALAGDRELLRLSTVHMASLGLYAALFAWLSTLFVRAGGHSLEASGAAASLALVAGIVGRPLGGWFVGRDARRARKAMAASLAGGSLGTLLLLPGGPLPLLALGCALLGFAAGVGFAPVFGEAARARPDAPGAAVGWVNTLGNVVAVVGTPLLGLAFALPWDGRLGFLVAALLWAAPLALLVERRRPPP